MGIFCGEIYVVVYEPGKLVNAEKNGHVCEYNVVGVLHVTEIVWHVIIVTFQRIIQFFCLASIYTSINIF